MWFSGFLAFDFQDIPEGEKLQNAVDSRLSLFFKYLKEEPSVLVMVGLYIIGVAVNYGLVRRLAGKTTGLASTISESFEARAFVLFVFLMVETIGACSLLGRANQATSSIDNVDVQLGHCMLVQNSGDQLHFGGKGEQDCDATFLNAIAISRLVGVLGFMTIIGHYYYYMRRVLQPQIDIPARLPSARAASQIAHPNQGLAAPLLGDHEEDLASQDIENPSPPLSANYTSAEQLQEVAWMQHIRAKVEYTRKMYLALPLKVFSCIYWVTWLVITSVANSSGEWSRGEHRFGNGWTVRLDKWNCPRCEALQINTLSAYISVLWLLYSVIQSRYGVQWRNTSQQDDIKKRTREERKRLMAGREDPEGRITRTQASDNLQLAAELMATWLGGTVRGVLLNMRRNFDAARKVASVDTDAVDDPLGLPLLHEMHREENEAWMKWVEDTYAWLHHESVSERGSSTVLARATSRRQSQEIRQAPEVARVATMLWGEPSCAGNSCAGWKKSLQRLQKLWHFI